MKQLLFYTLLFYCSFSYSQKKVIEHIETEITNILKNTSFKQYTDELLNIDNGKDSVAYWNLTTIMYHKKNIYKIEKILNSRKGQEKLLFFLKNNEPIKILKQLPSGLKYVRYINDWSKSEFIEKNKIGIISKTEKKRYSLILNKAQKILQVANNNNESLKKFLNN